MQQVDEISKDEWVSVIDWRRVYSLGGEEERATEGRRRNGSACYKPLPGETCTVVRRMLT